MNKKIITFGEAPLVIEDIISLAQGSALASLSNTDEYNQKIKAGVDYLHALLTKEGEIYGVTTGYGDSCTVGVPLNRVHELPINLMRFHGCGLGDVFSEEESAAILAARLASLTQGYSGVTPELLSLLVLLLNKRVLPIIPQEGSVGASGDLTPLSYVAAVLMGEREVWYQGQRLPTVDVFEQLNIRSICLQPKEGLAIMNGTAVMTALACLAYSRATYLSKLTTRITAMMSIALGGNPYHFAEGLFAVKPHQGQNQIAAWLRADLAVADKHDTEKRLQDRYSLRCAPHVIGVLQDALPWFRQFIETELNSANDNPIVDGINERIYHGGHFYGGHIAFAMDSMKQAIANLADLLDRQIALIMDTKFNQGLPANLSAATSSHAMINHGLKAVQIGASAWTAEALKLTMPASVFSRSTECHNQDKVSMGTIAARDCLRVLQLTEQVAAAGLLAVRQAIGIRHQQNDTDDSTLTFRVQEMYEALTEDVEFIVEDRPLETELRSLTLAIQKQKWCLYEA
ncbi:aromatic amino acid lyase [Zooshikella marina]|uniref:HAL/PAL/TAL family ammonia-lyase n=1 Tax=Zooshikella ganghwensis TaxID=202772 RepID=UPI001BB07B0B|nr:aromatic amino acid ammonia-lyase [Zooshikella ganghwensis]MBU2707246.1 aromatic amino acid lyase [Zooshikella ganghwensis]